MQQLIFDLYPAAPPSFDNFVVGHNNEALAAVRDFVEALSSNASLHTSHRPKALRQQDTSPPLSPCGRGAGGEGESSRFDLPEHRSQRENDFEKNLGLLLWGASGSGKTHLLQAARALALASGFSVHTLIGSNAFPPLPELSTPSALWIADDVDTADADLQGYLFTLYNALKENGGSLLVTASVPPAQLALREDLRTRLGWGGIYEIVTLRDEDKLQALIAHADTRGLRLPAEIVAYLLKYSRRDMRSLVAVLDALDRYSLSLKRPLTLPLVREWLSGSRDQGSGVRNQESPPLFPCGRGVGGEGERGDKQVFPPLQGETSPRQLR